MTDEYCVYYILIIKFCHRMGGTSSKEEIIVSQQQGSQSNTNIALSASALGFALFIFLLISCYLVYRKLKKQIVRDIQLNARPLV